MEIQIIKIKVNVDMDLTFTSLLHTIENFIEIFGIPPDTLKIGVDNIFTGIEIIRNNLDKKIKKKYKIKWFTIQCDKDFVEYYWELKTLNIKNHTYYILYSNGA